MKGLRKKNGMYVVKRIALIFDTAGSRTHDLLVAGRTFYICIRPLYMKEKERKKKNKIRLTFFT
jgi:hypothetical protein